MCNSHCSLSVAEQDKGLEELCKVIARQKEIGQSISNEVDHHNGKQTEDFTRFEIILLSGNINLC